MPQHFDASLVIPLLRQRDAWLHHCALSALSQSVPCEVIVVVSPHTPEGNLAVLERLARSHASLRVVMRPEGARFAGALNCGIAHVKTERFGLVLTDDWLEPDAVEACLRIDADIVSTAAMVWDECAARRLPALDRRRFRFQLHGQPTLERKAQYLGHFMLLSRRAVLEAGGVDETVGDSPGVDDYHLLWSMLERGATASICERPLYHHRDHEGERLTNRKPLEMLATMSRILHAHGLPPAEHEALLSWHARWFGRPLAACTTAESQSAAWRRSETPIDPDVDPRVRACLLAIEGAATLDAHADALARNGICVQSTALAALADAVRRALLAPAPDPAPRDSPPAIR
jgi:hypothetical protein